MSPSRVCDPKTSTVPERLSATHDPRERPVPPGSRAERLLDAAERLVAAQGLAGSRPARLGAGPLTRHRPWTGRRPACREPAATAGRRAARPLRAAALSMVLAVPLVTGCSQATGQSLSTVTAGELCVATARSAPGFWEGDGGGLEGALARVLPGVGR